MINSITFKIIVLICCLILAFLVGVSIKDKNDKIFPSVKDEECQGGIYPEPEEYKGDEK
jgi:hypothetical protein